MAARGSHGRRAFHLGQERPDAVRRLDVGASAPSRQEDCPNGVPPRLKPNQRERTTLPRAGFADAGKCCFVCRAHALLQILLDAGNKCGLNEKVKIESRIKKGLFR